MSSTAVESRRRRRVAALALVAVGLAWSVAAGAREQNAEPEPAQVAPPTSAAQPSPPPADDPGARLFVQKCSGCHTVGGGKLTGPDLSVAATWQPTDLERAIKLMEKHVGPLPDPEIRAIAELLKSPDEKTRIKAEQERAAKARAATLDPPSAEAGARLFTGAEPLRNGGAACIACHTAGNGGGTLGPDLSGVYARLGEAPLLSACEKANFKIMNAAYKNAPITQQEALHLTKYFSTLGAGTGVPARPPVAQIGLSAAVLALAATVLFYRRRTPGLRRRLIRRRQNGVD